MFQQHLSYLLDKCGLMGCCRTCFMRKMVELVSVAVAVCRSPIAIGQLREAVAVTVTVAVLWSRNLLIVTFGHAKSDINAIGR